MVSRDFNIESWECKGGRMDRDRGLSQGVEVGRGRGDEGESEVQAYSAERDGVGVEAGEGGVGAGGGEEARGEAGEEGWGVHGECFLFSPSLLTFPFPVQAVSGEVINMYKELKRGGPAAENGFVEGGVERSKALPEFLEKLSNSGLDKEPVYIMSQLEP